jgi:ribosome-binding factor A
MSDLSKKRLEKQIFRFLADLTLNDLENPNLGLFTLTEAELVDDLSLITIKVSVYGEAREVQATISALRRSAAYLRGRIGKVLKVHNIPKIYFVLDDSQEKQQKINSLLDGS